MKKDCKVKAHRRNGKMIKSHSRTIKGSMKNSGAGMSAEECKAKYDKMVEKYGEDSPQAKKLAIKMEGIETVEKEAKKKYTGTPEQQRIKAMKATGVKRKPKRPANGFTVEELKKAVVKRHSRGDYMRKNVEEEFLTKESKAKLKAKKGGLNLGRSKDGLEYEDSGKPVKPTGKGMKSKAVRKKSGNGFLGNKDSLGVPLDGVKSAGSSKKVKKK